MTAAAALKRLRLFPAVIALGAVLLAVKGFGLAFDARAQEQANPATPPVQGSVAAKPDPAADDTESTSAEVDVLTSLAKRRTALDAREQYVATREILIQAAEKRVDDKIATLKALQAQMQVLLGQRDDAEQKEITALTKTYSSMKPRDAARIFDNLNEDVLLAVAGQMKPDVLGAILAQMLPEAAQKLTVRLAQRTKFPDAVPAAPQMTMAALPAAASAQPGDAPSPLPATASAAPASPPPANAPAGADTAAASVPVQSAGTAPVPAK